MRRVDDTVACVRAVVVGERAVHQQSNIDARANKTDQFMPNVASQRNQVGGRQQKIDLRALGPAATRAIRPPVRLVDEFGGAF